MQVKKSSWHYHIVDFGYNFGQPHWYTDPPLPPMSILQYIFILVLTILIGFIPAILISMICGVFYLFWKLHSWVFPMVIFIDDENQNDPSDL